MLLSYTLSFPQSLEVKLLSLITQTIFLSLKCALIPLKLVYGWFIVFHFVSAAVHSGMSVRFAVGVGHRVLRPQWPYCWSVLPPCSTPHWQTPPTPTHPLADSWPWQGLTENWPGGGSTEIHASPLSQPTQSVQVCKRLDKHMHTNSTHTYAENTHTRLHECITSGPGKAPKQADVQMLQSSAFLCIFPNVPLSAFWFTTNFF